MTRFAPFVLLALAVPALPQSTFGTILGSVRDPAGAAMVGVKVSVTSAP
jgi:hypothetical protein